MPRDVPDKFWRRIGCIAYEDVGVASLEAVELATVALAGKRHHSARAGEWVITNCVVFELSRAPKIRGSDDLLKGTIETRALALWDALGTDRRPSVLVSRPAEPRLVFDYLCEAGWPHSIVAVAREVFRHGGDMTTATLLMSIRLARLATSRFANSLRGEFVHLSDLVCVVRLIA